MHVLQEKMEKGHGVPQKSIQIKKWKRINGLVVTAFVLHLKVSIYIYVTKIKRPLLHRYLLVTTYVIILVPIHTVSELSGTGQLNEPTLLTSKYTINIIKNTTLPIIFMVYFNILKSKVLVH